MISNTYYLLLIVLFSITNCSTLNKNQSLKPQTLFVVEFIRHGARSHYEDNVPPEFFGGIKPGYLTNKGKIEQLRVGQARRQEYVNDKKFLSEKYKQNEIMSISTFKQRCITSGEYYLRGLYPLENHFFSEDQLYHQYENSPIINTVYQEILKNILNDQQTCPRGPILEIPHQFDIMMHTRNCKHLHDYLNKDQYDVELLNQLLNEEFGVEVQKVKQRLEEYFKVEINNIREYFTLLDAIIAELYHTEQLDTYKLQRQETFILANNFIGPEDHHGNIFVSRMLTPMHQVLENVISNDKNKREQSLKYLIMNMHDTQISNILRVLKFFDINGYQKPVRFSSSLRIELIKQGEDNFNVRINFDNQDLHLPFCQHTHCTYEEFAGFLKANLYYDFEFIENYCGGNVGQEYINELKFRKTQ